MDGSISSLCMRLFFSSLRARFCSLRSALSRRLSSFSSARCASVVGRVVDIGLVGEVVVVVVPIAGFLAGSKPLQKKQETMINRGVSRWNRGTNKATASASASMSLMRWISANRSSSACFFSRPYQCTSLFFCQRPVGALILCPR